MLSKEQEKAIKMIKKYPISIINGYAGTGKSYLIDYIYSDLKKEDWTISKVSPTGRAAKRIKGKTIHSWLEPLIEEKENGDLKIIGFQKNKFKNNECLIIDESSMMDQEIFEEITKIWRNSSLKNKKVIFIGDSGQLEPVNNGTPFLDMINQKRFPLTTLTKIFRNNNDITQFAYKVRKKEKNIIDFKEYKNIKSCKLNDIFDKFLNNYKKYQIISPFNKYKNGTMELNKKIQARLLLENKINKKVFSSKKWVEEKGKWKLKKDIAFYIGDKVLFTKNILKTQIKNGTIAIVLKISKINKDKKITFLDIDNNKNFSIKLKKIEKNIALGYSISVHKAQGSEYDEICYILTKDQLLPFIFKNIKMHYTAITRAKNFVHIITNL